MNQAYATSLSVGVCVVCVCVSVGVCFSVRVWCETNVTLPHHLPLHIVGNPPLTEEVFESVHTKPVCD